MEGKRRGVGRGLDVLGRVVSIVAAVLAGVIVLGILFVVLEGNPRNDIVSTVLDIAEALVGPFDGLFTPENRKLEITINWGIAALLYLVVGQLIAGLLRRG